MSQRITIEIKDKIATCLTESPIVCGNADYIVDFVFDEEWNEHEVKTAMFIVNGQVTPQVFVGNACPVPVIQNTLMVWVGVFAGTVDDGTLSTSTPALVKCVPCITDGDNVPMAPPEDVYNQIIAMINAGMLKGDRGERGEKGDKGDAGAIKFIPVVRTEKENPLDDLPTENIDTSAIYLLPIESEDEQNKFTEYAYINGKWEILGAISIQVDHSEYVKFTDYASQDKAGVVKVSSLDYGVELNFGTLRVRQPNEWNIVNARNNGSYSPVTLSKADLTIKECLKNPLVEYSDEDKAKACVTIGAVKAFDGSKETGDLRWSVYCQHLGEQAQRPLSSSPKEGAIAVYSSGDTLTTRYVRNPNDCTNKEYVEDNFVAKPAPSEAGKSIITFAKNTGETGSALIEETATARVGWIPQYMADTLGNNEPNGTGVLVGRKPKQPYQFANKIYVDDGFVAKQNPEFDGGATRGYVYFIDPDGNQIVKKVQIQANSDTIPLRDSWGNFYVGNPELLYHCANKGYVDGLIAELLARIEALEAK